MLPSGPLMPKHYSGRGRKKIGTLEFVRFLCKQSVVKELMNYTPIPGSVVEEETIVLAQWPAHPHDQVICTVHLDGPTVDSQLYKI